MEKQHGFQQLFAAIEKRLRHIEEQHRLHNEERFDWIDAPDICQKLHISKRTLARYRELGAIPYSSLKGKLYYRLSDVEKILGTNLVQKYRKP